AVGDQVPIIAAIASMTTDDAVRQAKAARDAGCKGLMVLPPYIYRGDTREMKNHIATVCAATDLSCMLYNNPVAYGTDFLPERVCRPFQLRDEGRREKGSGDLRMVLASSASRYRSEICTADKNGSGKGRLGKYSSATTAS